MIVCNVHPDEAAGKLSPLGILGIPAGNFESEAVYWVRAGQGNHHHHEKL